VPPRPEWRGIFDPPEAAYKQPLGQYAEHNEADFRKHQGNCRTGEAWKLRSQQADVEEREDQPLGDRQDGGT
jgi:hypothetical protein